MTPHEQIIAYCKSKRFFKGIPDLDDNVAAWAEAYPVNILKELKGLNAWLIANPKKRPRNIAAFVDRNLKHAADRQDQPTQTTHQIAKTLVKSMASPGRGVLQYAPTNKTIDYAKRQRELAEQAKKLGIT